MHERSRLDARSKMKRRQFASQSLSTGCRIASELKCEDYIDYYIDYYYIDYYYVDYVPLSHRGAGLGGSAQSPRGAGGLGERGLVH